jgi:hypothetical protein
MKRILTLITLIVLFQSTISAQEMNVKGYVLDTSGVTPLKNAVVMAVRLKDSVLLNFTRTNQEGFFELNGFPVDTFSLLVDYPRFEQRNYFILGNKENSSIEINKIILSTKVKELEEVVIYANKNPIYYNGDTLVYVADSFKVAENAVVEDLLKKLPGITVDKNGKITSQGQDISKVLVDGDEFFGNDPTIATKNLGAKGIASVQVYEKKEENKEDGTEETIQVLDLKLKENAKNGYFGKATLASDFQNYHEGEFLFNKFNGSQRISVYALGSSTPRTGIGYADQNKFGVSSFSNNNSTGVPTTFTTGFSFVDKFGKKKQAKLSLDYTFNNYELRAATSSISQYILPTDTSYYTDDSTYNKSFQNSHNLSAEFTYQIDSLTSFIIKPSISASNNTNDNLSLSDFLTEDKEATRTTSILNEIETKDYNFSNMLEVNRKFMKARRNLNLSYYYSKDNRDRESVLLSSDVFINSTNSFTEINQKRTEVNSRDYHQGTIAYTEPIGKKTKLIFDYAINSDKSFQDVLTNDNNGLGVFSIFNSVLSNSFQNQRNDNRIGTKFSYESRKQVLTVGAYARNVSIDNLNVTTNTNINQSVNNILPTLNYTYKFSQTSRLKIIYNTYSSLPSVNDLQLVQNNTNTNRIVIGNPDLKPNYINNINIFYNTWNALTGRYIWSNLTGSITNNAFGDAIEYDIFGRTVSQRVNVNGNYNFDLRVGGGFPIYKRILSIRPKVNVGYSNLVSFINSEENSTINRSLSGELELRFQKDSLEFSLGMNQTYFNPTNSLGSVKTNPYSLGEYTAEITLKTKFNFKFQSDLTYTVNSQRADGYNIDFFVWNMSISRNFLSTENLVLSIVANDILNQNVAAARTVNGNIITDNRTQIISRYFLLKVIYKFNNNKTREEDAKMGWH